MTNLVLVVVGFSLTVNLVNQVKTVVSSKRLIANLAGKFEKLDEENRLLQRRIREVETSEEKERLYRQVLGWGTEEDYWVEP